MIKKNVFFIIIIFSFFILSQLYPNNNEELITVVPRYFHLLYNTTKKGHIEGFAINKMNKIASLSGNKIKYILKEYLVEVNKAFLSREADLISNNEITENTFWTTKKIIIFIIFFIILVFFFIFLWKHFISIKLNIKGEELQKDKSLLRQIVDNYPNSYISIIEKDLSIGFASGQEFKKINLDPDPFIGLKIKDVFKEHTSKIKRKFLDTFKGKETTFELFINNQHQLYKTVPLYDNGKINRILVVVENITERKHMEELLSNKESLLNEVGNIAKIGGWEMDLITRKAKWTKGTYDIVEIEEGQPIPGPDEHAEYYLPEFRPIIEEAMKNLIKNDIPLDFEAQLKTEKGNIKWCRALGKSIWQNGKCIKIFGTYQDITEQKKAEIELKNKNQFINSIVNLSPDILYIYDIVEQKNIFVNDGIQTVLGYTTEEIKIMSNQVISILMHPDDFKIYLKETFPKYYNLNDSELISHQFRMKHKNGNWLWLDSREMIYLRQHDGSPKQIFGVIHDITERKQTEKAMEYSEKRFRELFNNMSSGVAVYKAVNDGEDFIFMDFNRSGEKIEKIKKEQLIGKSVQKIFPGVNEFGLFEVFQRVYKTGKSEYHPINLYKDNRIISWRENYVYKLPSNEIVAVYDDATKRKQAEDELIKYKTHLEELIKERTLALEESNKELESFSYSISHDLKAPLRAIHGFSGILMIDYYNKLDDQAKEYLNIISRNIDTMRYLIDDLLNFSRISRKELNKVFLDVKVLIDEVCKELIDSEKKRNVEFVFKEINNFKGDKSMIKRVFINLISNAIKFTKNKKKSIIEISSKKDTNNIIYSIKDNGVGFDMKYYDKLFGVFQRLHGVKEFEGTGIGLALVKRIIEKHGGKVWAESKINKGASFYFQIPNL